MFAPQHIEMLIPANRMVEQVWRDKYPRTPLTNEARALLRAAHKRQENDSKNDRAHQLIEQLYSCVRADLRNQPNGVDITTIVGELQKLEGTPNNQLTDACYHFVFDSTIRKSESWAEAEGASTLLKTSASELLKVIKQDREEIESNKEIGRPVIQLLKTTDVLLKNPSDQTAQETYRKLLNTIKDQPALNKKLHSSKKMIYGLGIAFLGAALITASFLLAFGTYGGGMFLSAIILKMGWGMVMKGLAMTGVATLFGAGVSVGGYLGVRGYDKASASESVFGTALNFFSSVKKSGGPSPAKAVPAMQAQPA